MSHAGAKALHRHSVEPSAAPLSAVLLPSRLYRWFRLPALVLAFRWAIAHMLVFRLFEGSMMALSFTLGPVDTSREATNVSQLCWRPDGNSLIVLSYSSLSLSSIALVALVWLTQPRYPLRKPCEGVCDSSVSNSTRYT